MKFIPCSFFCFFGVSAEFTLDLTITSNLAIEIKKNTSLRNVKLSLRKISDSLL